MMSEQSIFDQTCCNYAVVMAMFKIMDIKIISKLPRWMNEQLLKVPTSRVNLLFKITRRLRGGWHLPHPPRTSEDKNFAGSPLSGIKSLFSENTCAMQINKIPSAKATDLYLKVLLVTCKQYLRLLSIVSY